MSVFPPDENLPSDDRQIEFEKEEPAHKHPPIFWDPINLSLGLLGALLIFGGLPLDNLTRFETLVTGGFCLYVSGRQLIGFYVPLAPNLLPLMVVTRIVLSIVTVITPILLITS